MKKLLNVQKWITVAILSLCVILFFCPYITILGESYNPVQLLSAINESGSQVRNDATFEVVITYIIPVILTALSAFILALKISIPKSVICMALNLVSVIIYAYSINANYFNVRSGDEGIGLIMNLVIAFLGIFLPIITIILRIIVKALDRKKDTKELQT